MAGPRPAPPAADVAASGPVPAFNGLRIAAIGASAGGLDAFRRLVSAIPPASGVAWILVQHLEPNHASMIVPLIADHTGLPVTEAADGMALVADHIYVIPPRAFLSAVDDVLHIFKPTSDLGARLPFDVLLNNLAQHYGPRAAAVTLTGTGSDGALGSRALKAQGGQIFVQSPEEAEFDGMPQAVISTGCADQILPIAEIPAAVVRHDPHPLQPVGNTAPGEAAVFQAILDLVRHRTDMDFGLYKPGTVRRRIERRIGLAGLKVTEAAAYLARLSTDDAELDHLSADLLINVTAFFRDPEIFEALALRTLPDIIAAHRGDGPIRVWVAGCSTGQEAYSLAILFLEGLEAAGGGVELQIFATDIDEDAIAQARMGRYPATIAAEVRPERLKRYFVKDRDGFQVSPALRQRVVFSVQDLLQDPPFSRLDMVSCRNLLIYFGPEAQAKALSLFHFALLPDGVLLLGGAEAPAHGETSFATLSKSDRTFRRMPRRDGTGPKGALSALRVGAPDPMPDAAAHRKDRPTRVSDLTRDLIVAEYAPPTILITPDLDCLHTVGDLDPYLRVPAGEPSRSLLDQARPAYVATLRAALHLAQHDRRRVSLAVSTAADAEAGQQTLIEVTPVQLEGSPLFLVSFRSQPIPQRPGNDAALPDAVQTALQEELAAARMQLAAAISDLDAAAIDRKIISEEAQSIQEEYQSTNEELLTSKEELQSLNEELTALNTQLQETLEQQRSASSDLQNVLYSTNIATLFLDRKLQIRFYTPATTALFRLIPSDVGRPLADLKSVATDPTLLGDASRVLETLTTAEYIFQAADSKWFRRRIFPYIGADGGVSGVVITFSDVTDQHAAATALDLARSEAERANAAKSRFLAAASHDLRQPLQTLSLLQGLLAKTVSGDGPARLIARFDETLSAMSGMLNTLLDINQIEAGEVRPVRSDLAIGPVLQLIKDEFTYHALAKRLTLRVVPSRALVNTDSRLLEQILRNLVSNALKYTPEGKVLVGCRRRGDRLRIEIWDTGVGIPEADQARIFEEYQQLDNEARERSKGIGLGLAIVKQLAGLLEHKVTVGSVPGTGSLFAIELPLIRPQVSARATGAVPRVTDPTSLAGRAGTILVVEDDPELRALLVEVLSVDGHRVLAAASGPEALAVVQRERFRADVMLIDYNLPGGMDGIETSRQLNIVAGQAAAVIVLTGDISTRAQLAIESGGAVRLSKPIKTDLLRETLRHVLAAGSRPRPLPATVAEAGEPMVYLVDDDDLLRQTLRDVLEAEGRTVQDFASCEAFLRRPGTHRGGCLLLDAYLPGMSGLELLKQLSGSGHTLPTIVMTGRSDIATAVNAMKAGAIDFIQKPVSRDDLVAVIDRALEQARDTSRASEWRDDAIRHIHALTPRQREVMDLVLAGHPSKNIAADLGISQRTVENHRASIMKRTGTRSLPALARLAVAAALSSDAPSPA